MISLFFKEHIAWLLFLVIWLVITNIIYILDAGVSTVSLVYLNSVHVLLLVAFLTVRFLQQRRLLRHVLRDEPMNDLEEEEFSAIQRLFWQQAIRDVEEQKLQRQMLQVEIYEERDDILAWAHEMKSPMTALKLMQEQIENPKLQRKVQAEWLRLYLLLDQRLHQTRLATMAQDNRFEHVSLRRVVYQEIKDLQSLCMEKGIGFEVEDLNVDVVTDAKWLGFIVRQVLSNAVKYSELQANITVDCYEEQGHVVLTIQDEGCGIRPEDLPRIFKKSYTGTVGRETTASTGMGLYLAKRAADELGITLKVKSTLNEGTYVFIQFPLENDYIQSFGM